MIRNIIFLFCCIAVGESYILSDFQTFKTKFNKTYKDDLEVIKSISLFRVINLLYTITIKVIRLRSLQTVNFFQTSYRLKVFEHNLEMIQEHNRNADKGVYTYTLGVNQFADLTNEEWEQYIRGSTLYQMNPKLSPKNSTQHNRPESVDWSDEVRTSL